MKCSTCGEDTEVVDSRPTSGGKSIRRRRRCPAGHRMTTFEVEMPTRGRMSRTGRKTRDSGADVLRVAMNAGVVDWNEVDE